MTRDEAATLKPGDPIVVSYPGYQVEGEIVRVAGSQVVYRYLFTDTVCGHEESIWVECPAAIEYVFRPGRVVDFGTQLGLELAACR